MIPSWGRGREQLRATEIKSLCARLLQDPQSSLQPHLHRCHNHHHPLAVTVLSQAKRCFQRRIPPLHPPRVKGGPIFAISDFHLNNSHYAFRSMIWATQTWTCVWVMSHLCTMHLCSFDWTQEPLWLPTLEWVRAIISLPYRYMSNPHSPSQNCAWERSVNINHKQ